jgi:hypothetical protein
MKLTLIQIHNAFEKMQEFSKKELPFKISYNVCRNLQKLEPEYQLIMEIKRKVFTKYGKEENGLLTVSPDKIVEATKELNELLIGDTEIDIRTIKMSELLKDETIKVTPQDLFPLLFMFEEGE